MIPSITIPNVEQLAEAIFEAWRRGGLPSSVSSARVAAKAAINVVRARIEADGRHVEVAPLEGA